MTTVSVEEHEQLERELADKEKALAEMTVMFIALKKKQTWNKRAISQRAITNRGEGSRKYEMRK